MERPHILVNVAMTVDGKIDSIARKGATISSNRDKARVDGLRASVDAVLVGGRTLLDEDPKLTVKSAALRAERLRKGWSENPAKVGVISEIPATCMRSAHAGKDIPSKRGSVHLPLQRFLTSGPARVFLITTGRTSRDTLSELKSLGITIMVIGKERVGLERTFKALSEAGIRTVLVEGGGTLIAELFRLNMVDELTIYVAAKIFGGRNSPTLADGPGFPPRQAPGLRLVSVEKFDDEGGLLVHYSVEKGG
jgi:2,5-diamino-6-(ribosylamino)-4(3H)-pyrimidinone 5'-phosphate reductase